MSLENTTKKLKTAVNALSFTDPVAYVYNPLVHARRPHAVYLHRFGKGKKEAVFLGMNPGPFGMAQTGIPFGDVSMVRDWMHIEAPVERPENEHPKRPVLGFECPRSEVSGTRLWGWARDRFDTPEDFFERFFVINYCPLCFMDAGGRNVTPDKLPVAERAPLEAACDTALASFIEELDPELVIGVGQFAEKCAQRVLADVDVRIGRILHPSPASPAANRGWAEQAERGLSELGVKL
jgi:single-strand selective monofunctional uracil DNA glycosylase